MALVSFPFTLQEQDVIPNLLQQILTKELATLMMMCNVAHRAECDKHSKNDIWKVLPPYFKEGRLHFQKDTDAVYAAAHDRQRFELWADIENNPDDPETYYVALSVVEEHYRLKWRDLMGNNYADPFMPQKYTSAFQSAGITGPFPGFRRDPHDQTEVHNMWLVGIREVIVRGGGGRRAE